MRTLHTKLILIAILIITFVIRFYNLGIVPHGMTWDEAATGYNGYSILTTRRDEWLERLPVSFKSFGDYKAPLAIYINGIFTFIFGMNLLAVRLPFAISGLLAVFIIYKLIKKIFQDSQYATLYGLIAAIFLSLNPWHIHYSRIGFESGISLTIVLIFVYLFISIFDYKERKITLHSIVDNYWQSVKNIITQLLPKSPFLYKSLNHNLVQIHILLKSIACSLALSGSLYAYHSAKVVIPFLLLLLCCFYLEGIKKYKYYFLTFISFSLIFLYPLITDSIYGKGLERAGVSVFSTMSVEHAVITSLTQLGMHFTPDFLIFGQTNDLRHGDGKWGVLYQSDFIIISLGILLFLYSIIKKISVRYNTFLFGLLWIIIGIIPAAITQDAPHSNRALLALPGFILVYVCSLEALYTYMLKISGTVGKKAMSGVALKMAIGVLILLNCFFTISYLHNYFTIYAKESAHAFSEGYIEAFEIVSEYEKGINNKRQVQRILFTTEYRQPYIYALFVRRTNPIWYHGGSLINYEFTNKITESDLERDNVLIVAGRSSTLDESKATHLIKDTSGRTRFKIYLTEDK